MHPPVRAREGTGGTVTEDNRWAGEGELRTTQRIPVIWPLYATPPDAARRPRAIHRYPCPHAAPMTMTSQPRNAPA